MKGRVGRWEGGWEYEESHTLVVSNVVAVRGTRKGSGTQ